MIWVILGNIRNLALSFVLLLSLVYTGANSSSAQKPASPTGDSGQPKFALLVGITNFKNEKINKIDGCENNVPLLAETLIKNFGFEENQIVTKLNADATKDSIMNSFRSHLIENARNARQNGKEAAVLFYFCGHGSQYPDQDKDENDGLDETLVAHDSRTGEVFDILDDEIDDLKFELRRETSNATFVLESCHSGTGTREAAVDKEYVTQEVDGDTRARKPYVRKHPATTDEDVLTATELSASTSYRTAKSETAKYCNCARPYSLMTKALVEALNRATPTTTYRQLMREVSTRVSERSQQDPQVDGNRDAFLFGGAARRANPYIEVDRMLPNDQIRIRAGKVHGLKPGSQVTVYASTAPTHSGTEGWLSNGIVTDVRDFLSDVKLPTRQENPKVAEIKESSHVVFASPVLGGGSVLVALDAGSKEPGLDKAIRDHLADYGLLESQLVKLIPAENTAPAERDSAKGLVRLKKGTIESAFPNKDLAIWPKPTARCSGDAVVWDEPEKVGPTTTVYYLDDGSPGGTPLFGKFFLPNDKNLAAEIAWTIRNFSFRTNLRSLDNAVSNLSSQVRLKVYRIANLEIIDVCRDGEVKKTARTKPQPSDYQEVKTGRIPVDTAFSFALENISGELRRRKDKDASGEELHAAAIFLQNNGDIKVVQLSGPEDPIFDSKSKPFFSFIATKPVGIEQLIVVVSKKYVDFGFYNSTAAKRTALSPLELVLSQSGTRTRDTATLIPDQPDQWGVINIELNIVDKL